MGAGKSGAAEARRLQRHQGICTPARVRRSNRPTGFVTLFVAARRAERPGGRRVRGSGVANRAGIGHDDQRERGEPPAGQRVPGRRRRPGDGRRARRPLAGRARQGDRRGGAARGREGGPSAARAAQARGRRRPVPPVGRHPDRGRRTRAGPAATTVGSQAAAGEPAGAAGPGHVLRDRARGRRAHDRARARGRDAARPAARGARGGARVEGGSRGVRSPRPAALGQGEGARGPRRDGRDQPADAARGGQGHGARRDPGRHRDGGDPRRPQGRTR